MTVCEILDLIRLPTSHGHNAALATAHLIDNLHLLYTRSKQLGPNHIDGGCRMGRQWERNTAASWRYLLDQPEIALRSIGCRHGGHGDHGRNRVRSTHLEPACLRTVGHRKQPEYQVQRHAVSQAKQHFAIPLCVSLAPNFRPFHLPSDKARSGANSC